MARTREAILASWPVKPRESKRTPFGYFYTEEDRNTWLPDEGVIYALDEALDMLDAGVSFRKAVEWLNSNIPEGKHLTHAGLQIVRNKVRPDYVRHKPSRKPKEKMGFQERLEYRRKIKLATDKRKIKAAEKRIEKHEAELKEIKGIQEPMEVLAPGETYDWDTVEEIKQDADVYFTPNPGPQMDFLGASEFEVLYGGAAGGGKSYALIADPMRYFSFENFNGLILRRTMDELRELIRNTQQLYPRIFNKASGNVATWKESSKTWHFQSGAQLWMAYLDRDEDTDRYHGQAFTWVGFDELTKWPTPYPWNFMRSRVRTTDDNLRPYLGMRGTTNPGGPGHGWVKQMFIDPAPYNTAFIPVDIDTGEQMLYPKGHEREGQPLFYRRFIPAKVQDNPYLWADGSYEASLLSLPEQQRRQLLDGDWNVVSGAAFPEFRVHTHVCEPFEIPSNWRRFRSCDFGFSQNSASAVHWWAVTPENNLVVYRELYINQKTAQQLARMILEIEQEETISYGVLDSSCWQQRGNTGPSIAEEMIRAGCKWRPSDRSAGSRIQSKNRLHELLKPDRFTGQPGIMFFNNCRRIIADMQVLPVDPDGSDDIDVDYQGDHAYDSIRYGAQSRPRAQSIFDIMSNGRTAPVGRKVADATFGY